MKSEAKSYWEGKWSRITPVQTWDEYLRDMSPMIRHEFQDLRAMVQNLAPRGRRVLDVGGGRGYVLKFLFDESNQKFLIDLSQEAIEHARTVNGIANAARADILTDPFPFDGLFDVILLTEVIEHIHPLQLAEFSGSLAGRLAAGGTLIATTPNLTSFSSRLKMAAGLKPNFFTLDPTHITPFRPADLDRLWTTAGLTTISVRTTRAMMPVLRGWYVPLPFRWNLGDHIVGVWRKA